MLRGDPDLILDSCSVRAKRGGDLTGPNPTDRGKRGTKYHIATTGDGVPVACAATAANVNDTLAVRAAVPDGLRRRGPDRDRVRGQGLRRRAPPRAVPGVRAPSPGSTSAAGRTGSGLGKRRWPVERSNAWLLENKRLALRYDRLGFVVQSLLQAACLFLVPS